MVTTGRWIVPSHVPFGRRSVHSDVSLFTNRLREGPNCRRQIGVFSIDSSADLGENERGVGLNICDAHSKAASVGSIFNRNIEAMPLCYDRGD
jgi:hypothetical protein